MNNSRIIIAGTNSRVGKTTITMGIILALKKRGFNVAVFKTGPDYIDPGHLSGVAGNICRNLDSWMLSKNAIIELFERQAKEADISVIEGVMGLYDGFKNTEIGSTAHLAKILNCPVILVIDAKSMSRSAGAVALGYKKFDEKVQIKGIILNNIGSENHYSIIKSTIESNADVPALGYLPKDKYFTISERHLGLVTHIEKPLDIKFNNKLIGLIEKNIDIGGIIKISKKAKQLPNYKKRIFIGKPQKKTINILAAYDEAFNFYYQDNLDILNYFGANIIKFSPLYDTAIPDDVDGIYFGGGFPELYAEKLSKNIILRKNIFIVAKNGLPIYAECGGLMYLMKKIEDFNEKKYQMIGIFNNIVKMGKKLKALGYVKLRVKKTNIVSNKNDIIKAHVFHWSFIDGAGKKSEYAYEAQKNRKIFLDGFVKWNVLASYSHIHFASNINFAKKFIGSCLKYKNEKENNFN